MNLSNCMCRLWLHQIRNSNSYALAALVEGAGGVALRLPHAADTHEALAAAIYQAGDCDLLLFSGGVSAGRHDLVEGCAGGPKGAEFYFTGVRMQPGRPSSSDAFRHTVSGLRGTSSVCPAIRSLRQVTFLVFAHTLLAALGGAGAEPPALRRCHIKRRCPEKARPHALSAGHPDADVAAAHSASHRTPRSGDLAANARANCYAVLPPECERMAAGESVAILLR